MKRSLRKAGFVSFGEVNSPRELIESLSEKALNEIASLDVNIVTTPTVTDAAGKAEIKRAISELHKQEFDVLIVCIAGWIPSYAVIEITEKYRDKPMILWSLAGSVENGRIVTTAAQAGATALRKVFEELGYKFRFVYNTINKPSPLSEIEDFITASFAAVEIRDTKIGMMGHRDMHLYNTLYDGVSLKFTLGTDIEFFEMLEMEKISERTDTEEIERILSSIKQQWNFQKPVDQEFLKKGIAYFIAIKQLVQENGYNAISLKDVDGMKRLLNFPPAFVFMLLSDELKLCTIPENDAMGAVTQLVIKELTGQCAAYLEFYEFFENSVLMGVPDYVPAEVVDGKVQVTSSAFGQISGGLLNVSTMKTGRLTLARLSNSGDRYTMHACLGTAKLCSWEEAGWAQPAPQLPSLEIILDTPTKEFVQEISGQHYIIAYGDHLRVLRDFCYLKNIKLVQ